MCWNKALTFGVGSIKLSFRAIVFTQYMHAKMFSIQMLLNVYTFQSNCAEGLHFSAFHSLCYTDTSIEESMVSDREDAVHGHVSDTSPLPSERSPETSSIFV